MALSLRLIGRIFLPPTPEKAPRVHPQSSLRNGSNGGITDRDNESDVQTERDEKPAAAHGWMDGWQRAALHILCPTFGAELSQNHLFDHSKRVVELYLQTG